MDKIKSTILAREKVLQDIADNLNKAVSDLKPFRDYNPIQVDEAVRRLTQPIGYHWAGD